MSSREEFEAWLSREYPWGNEALDKAFFSGNDDNGYYTGGDFIYDGSSCADALFWAWRGWQESHKRAEAKCAALAAENAGLKDFLHSRVDESICDKHIKTPATDAFLAEVRASGVDLFFDENPAALGNGNIKSLRERFLPKIKSGEIGGGDYMKRKDTDLQEAAQ